MLDGLVHKLTGIHKVAGVELTIHPDGKADLSVVILSLQKQSLITEYKKSGIPAIQDLKEHIPSDIPISLIINGKGILHKKLTGYFENRPAMIQASLPNANPEDFCFQQYQTKEAVFVSLIRKDQLNMIIMDFMKAGYYVISSTLGGYGILNLVPLINKEKEPGHFSHHHFLTEKDLLKEYRYNPASFGGENVMVDKEIVPEQLLAAYAAAFNSIIPTGMEIQVESDSIVSNSREFQGKRLFKLAGIGVVIFFLLLVVTNMILFMQFSSKHDELVSKEGIYKGIVGEQELMEKDIKEKETFLSQAGWMDESKMSYYADRLATTIPSSVKLTELSINPVNQQESQKERKEIFETGKIRLSGNCSKPTELNEWIKELKRKEWAREVSMGNYSYDHMHKVGLFNIDIEVK